MSTFALETARLTIRPFVRSDLEGLVEYRTLPEVARFQDWDASFDVADAERYLGSSSDSELGTPGEWTQFALVERDSGRLCGDIGVHFVEAQPDTVEVGITLSLQCQGQGVGTEAMHSVVDWLFSDMAAHRVFAHVDARNAPARGLLARLGFRQEAELRDADWFKGEWTTLCIYAILAEEWIGESSPADPPSTDRVNEIS